MREDGSRHAICRSPFSVDKFVNNNRPVAEDAGFEAWHERSAYFLGIGDEPIRPQVIVELRSRKSIAPHSRKLLRLVAVDAAFTCYSVMNIHSHKPSRARRTDSPSLFSQKYSFGIRWKTARGDET